MAYCGLSDNADHLYAIIVEVGRKKPVVKKAMGPPLTAAAPDSECGPPLWERKPMRVTFAPMQKEKLSFTVRGRLAEIETLEKEEGDEGDKQE